MNLLRAARTWPLPGAILDQPIVRGNDTRDSLDKLIIRPVSVNAHIQLAPSNRRNQLDKNPKAKMRDGSLDATHLWTSQRPTCSLRQSLGVQSEG